MSRPIKRKPDTSNAGHDAASVDLRLAAIDIPPRLTFLNELRGRSAFEGSAVLDQIIADYRRALATARGVDVCAGNKS